MLNIAGGILFSRVGCDNGSGVDADEGDEDDQGGKEDVLRRAASLRTLPRCSRGASPVAAGSSLAGRGSPSYRVASLRAYNRGGSCPGLGSDTLTFILFFKFWITLQKTVPEPKPRRLDPHFQVTVGT